MTNEPKPASRSLSWACQAMRGTVLGSGPALDKLTFRGAASDSRAAGNGRLFFALPGERVDGFDFCAAAAAAGAAAVVVAQGRGRPAGCEAIPVIAVADPRHALAELARAVRRDFRGKVVGITGSNGKTTTKELVAAGLSATGTVLRTAGNLNTEIGLPLTILESTGEEDFWVLEMAMRARGEIALLADIAKPHVGVVTNVAAAHLGRLGSLDEVAKAKGEIFHGLGADGIAILPVDDPRLEREAALLPEARKLRIGTVGPKTLGSRADLGDIRVLDYIPSGAAGSVVRYAVRGEPAVVRLRLAGEHNARNGAVALAVTCALGLPAAPAALAIGGATLPPHRSAVVVLGGRTVLDDCYNANPASMLAALRTLTAGMGPVRRAFAVLGDMLELGPDAKELHAELGKDAAGLGLTGLVAFGTLGAHFGSGARQAGLAESCIFATAEPDLAVERLCQWTRQGDWILVKASRGMRLERVIDGLTAAWGPITQQGG